jgi:hypothetical protein
MATTLVVPNVEMMWGLKLPRTPRATSVLFYFTQYTGSDDCTKRATNVLREHLLCWGL